jgi:hypothetical protein
VEQNNNFREDFSNSLKEQEKEELEKNKDLIENFKRKCQSLEIDPDQIQFGYRWKTGITANYPNILCLLNPELTFDKEGLVSFSELKTSYHKKPFCFGYWFADDYVVMSSHYYRRSMHQLNHYAPRFIEYLESIKDENLAISVRVETNEVRIDNSLSVMELDTWYGASFKTEIASIKDGITKLVPPPILDEADIEMFFNYATALNIKWDTKEDKEGKYKNFQSEEFKTENFKIDLDKELLHPSKYLHAEFDFGKKQFRHLDGAIHFYNNLDYQQVRYSDFNYNSKNSVQVKGKSTKLFRINGELSVENWMQLVSQFLGGNPLIIEYFEGKFPEHIQEIIDIREKNNRIE